MSNINDMKVNQLTTKNQDFHGRRITNAGDAQDSQDYVTQHDLLSNLAPSAYTDTTDAGNIKTGLLNYQRIPYPAPTSIGGIKSIVLAAHKFIQWIDNFGNPQLAQPAFSDLSGSIVAAQVPASLKPVSNQNVVTGSRSLGTVFQNTNATPMFVTITFNLTCTGTTPAIVSVATDSSNPPTTIIGGIDNSVEPHAIVITSFIAAPITFIVLPGNFYEAIVGSGTCSLNTWTEWF